MSLDVYLTGQRKKVMDVGKARIILPLDGEEKEVSWQEWREQYSHYIATKIVYHTEPEEFFQANITHKW